MKGADKKNKDQCNEDLDGKNTSEDSSQREEDVSAQTSAPQENIQNEEGLTEKTEEKSVQDSIEELKKENAELKDQYLRKLADFDNYRKRMIKEKQDAIDFANTNLLKDLVTVLDDFDRALSASSDEENPVVQGIVMINKQLRSMLDVKYNLVAYGEKGDEFDHDKHEAIATNQAPVAEPVCAEVYLKGYSLKDRVVRPAKVMVHMPDGTVSADSK